MRLKGLTISTPSKIITITNTLIRAQRVRLANSFLKNLHMSSQIDRLRVILSAKNSYIIDKLKHFLGWSYLSA